MGGNALPRAGRVEGSAAGLRVDVRTKPAEGTTSVASLKEVPDEGEVRVLVSDDEQLGCAAVVVLGNAAGRVVAKQITTIGER